MNAIDTYSQRAMSQRALLEKEGKNENRERRRKPSIDADEEEGWRELDESAYLKPVHTSSASSTPSKREVRLDQRNKQKEKRKKIIDNAVVRSLNSLGVDNSDVLEISDEKERRTTTPTRERFQKVQPKKSVLEASQPAQNFSFPVLRSKPLPSSQSVSKIPPSASQLRSKESRRVLADQFSPPRANHRLESNISFTQKADHQRNASVLRQSDGIQRGEPMRRISLSDQDDEITLDQGCGNSQPLPKPRNVRNFPASFSMKSSLTSRFKEVSKADKGTPNKYTALALSSSKSLPSNSSRRASTSSMPCREVVEEIIAEGKAGGEFSTHNQQRKSSQTPADSNEDEVQFVAIRRNSIDDGQQHGRSAGAQASRGSSGSKLITNSNQRRVGSREIPTSSCYGHGSSGTSRMKRQKLRDERSSLPANSSPNTRPTRPSRASLNPRPPSVFENRITEPVDDSAPAVDSESEVESCANVPLHETVQADIDLIDKALCECREENMGVVVLHYQGITTEILGKLCKTFNEITLISKLKLSNNKIDSLPLEMQETCRRSALWVLDMSGNQIERLPPWFYESSSQLQHLNLSHNNLVELDPKIGFFTELTFLNLSNNRLRELPKGLGRLKRLSILDVRSNLLEKLPDDFGSENHGLVCFDISNNPEFRCGLPLHFKENNLDKLQDVFFKGTPLYSALTRKERRAEGQELASFLAGITIEDVEEKPDRQRS